MKNFNLLMTFLRLLFQEKALECQVLKWRFEILIILDCQQDCHERPHLMIFKAKIHLPVFIRND